MTPTTPLARAPRTPRRGFTLIEMLLAVTIFSLVISAAFGFLLAQSRSFRRIGERSNLVQNMRFGRDILRQELRATGTNVTDEQPMIVFGSDSVFAFNADLTTNVEDSVALTGAVYVDPFAPDSQVSALRQSASISIPGAGMTYPLADYSQNPLVFINSDAETVTFWFATDTSTSTSGDFMLVRQVNRSAPEVLLRNVKRRGSLPFFRYWYDASRYGAIDPDLQAVPVGWLPLMKNTPRRGVMPDTGTATTTRIDQVRAVEVNYEVETGTGSTARTSLVNYMVPMPNTAKPRLRRICGRVPLFGNALSAVVQGPANNRRVQLSWGAATDQTTGEQDVIRYVIWRREVGAPDWGDPHVTVGATTATTYTTIDAGVTPGLQYEYAIAVQDCTPNVSGLSASNQVTIPNP
ncbi:MAG: prepilin-type N-terminal cleavage/methylation domain-containing protein [Gemmatimonadaceae bacterium]|jgi:prepilin-type N-terminal cleavage/methylation domain-containing protein|nr:prepilin-type N-terminal cleavage/methylation domain-containing protein [Gemmatimonadaceae bacterium]